MFCEIDMVHETENTAVERRKLKRIKRKPNNNAMRRTSVGELLATFLGAG